MTKIVLSTLILAYFIIALANVISGARLTLYPSRLPRSQRAFFDAVVESHTSRTRTQVAAGLLEIPSLSLLWPTNRRFARELERRGSNIEYFSRIMLRPRIAWFAIGNLGLLLVVAGLGLFDLIWQPLFEFSVWFVLGAVIAKHLAYVLGSLREQLRRSSLNPYVTFASIVLVDGLVLTICIALLRTREDQSIPLSTALAGSASALFNVPENIKDLAGLSIAEIATAMVGLLYYTTLVKAALTPKEFQRTDDDHRAIANLWANVGDYERARTWLDKEQDRKPLSHSLRARISLADENFERALDFMRRSLAMDDLESSDDAVIIALSGLSTYSGFPSSTRQALCKHLLLQGAYSDAALALLVGVQGAFVDDRVAFVDGLIGLRSEAEYPVTLSTLVAMRRDYAEACAIVDRARPGTEIEELLRLVRRCAYVCLDPDVSPSETCAYLNEWYEQSLDTIVDLVPTLSDMHSRMAMPVLLDLRAVHDAFVARYGVEDPYTPQRASRLSSQLLSLAERAAPTKAEFLSAQRAMRFVYASYSRA